MYKDSTFLPKAPLSWTSADLQTLRMLAEAGESVEVMARTLGRSVSAVRNKVAMHGISVTRKRPDIELRGLQIDSVQRRAGKN